MLGKLLRKVYPDGVPTIHSTYQTKMDRDKGCYACERGLKD
nr:excalibur calcium-binding domain-containing protein [Mesobacillus subterraneus]